MIRKLFRFRLWRMDQSRESARLKAIERQLAKAKKRYRKVAHVYAQVAAERKALDAQINSLIEERSLINQGQLFLPKLK